MKKSVVKTGLIVIVLAAVIAWSLLTNSFRGHVTESAAVASTQSVSQSATTVSSAAVVQEQPAAQAPIQISSAPVAVIKNDSEDFPQSKFCRAQFEELITIKTGKEFRALVKKNPNSIDKKCFLIPGPLKMDGDDCYKSPTTSVFGRQEAADTIQDAICGAFLIYAKYMLADYLYQDLSDIKNMPDHILRAKAGAQLLFKDDLNVKAIEALGNEVLKRSPEDVQAIKIYLRSQYVLGRALSETSSNYQFVTKAYNLAPRDSEIQEFFAFATMTSPNGLYKLSQLNIFTDKYHVYYFYAWANWIAKTDINKVKAHLNTGLEKSSNFKSLFKSTLQKVNDSNVAFGQDKIFNIGFDPLVGANF